MNVGRMSGTPWHAERVHREDGDDRRYKGRCQFYEYKDGSCSRRNGKCIGSAHCMEYEAVSEEEFQKRQMKNAKKSSKKKDDDMYWY